MENMPLNVIESYRIAGIFARFIFRVFLNLTKFAKVYPANLLISQYNQHVNCEINSVKCLFEREIAKIYPANFLRYTYANANTTHTACTVHL